MSHRHARLRLLLCSILLALISAGKLQAEGVPRRERFSLNAGWRFQKNDPADAGATLSYSKLRDWLLPSGNAFVAPDKAKSRPSGDEPGKDVSYVQSGFDDTGWRKVNLPHDWGVEGPFQQELQGETGKLPYAGIGWYRKHFNVPMQDQGRALFLQIDGAMSNSAVWLNGHLVGGWPYGYSSYELDLTPFIKMGSDNVLAVRLDNPSDSSRWYPGGGIYRNVWLLKTNPTHLSQWGVYVTTPEISANSATVTVSVKIDHALAPVTVSTAIYEPAAAGARFGAQVATAQVPGAANTNALAMSLRVKTPKLWSPDTPNLYLAVTTVQKGGQVVDQMQTYFGIRTAKFDPNQGFLLNEKILKLNGVCQHADLGALGMAVNTRALQRQIEILKEMGCNAIRTSHNMPAPELLDLCDRMGMLVMDESFDCWEKGKKPGDYHNYFNDWHEQDIRAEARRDRNHPSVILYSIGNEIPQQGTPEGLVIGSQLTTMIHEEDPTRPTTIGCSATGAGYNDFVKAVDVFGYNYKPGEYAKWHLAHPTQALFGSETSSTVSSRGEYFFPLNVSQSDFQVSSYDNWKPGWATSPDTEFKGQDQNPFVAGEFVWTGFDYLGEPTPYTTDTTNLLNWSNPEDKAKAEAELKAVGKLKVPSRSSYFGIVDLCGFKKDRFYLYQSKWRPELPMAHILPHWNWPGREGQVTPVYVYTSGDEAELFLNGKSLGRKKKGAYEYRLKWDDVKYQPGELKVIAYKAGREWAKDSVKTSGPAAKIMLQPDRTRIAMDGEDLSYVTVTVADRDGQLVPRSKNLIKFEVSGPAEIVATDNGDATDLSVFQNPVRKAFNGLALAIIRAKPDAAAGMITLRATSDGLQAGEVRLQGVAPAIR